MVTCLDISNFEPMGDLSPEPVPMEYIFDTMELFFRNCPWQAVCLIDTGDRRIADWCMRSGWTQDENRSPRELPDYVDCFYMLLPTDGTTIVGVTREAGMLALPAADVTLDDASDID